MTVTLMPAAMNTTPSEPRMRTETKMPPSQPTKPKAPSKPKAITPKTVTPKSDEPALSKTADEHPIETAQEKITPGASTESPASSSAQTGAITAEPPPGHFEGPKLNADYLHNPRPDYPHQAKRMGWEGRVVLRVEVLSNGSVGAVSVAKSSGHELLDEAALEAVRHWKFVPAKRDGTAVSSSVNVPLNFNLKNE